MDASIQNGSQVGSAENRSGCLSIAAFRDDISSEAAVNAGMSPFPYHK